MKNAVRLAVVLIALFEAPAAAQVRHVVEMTAGEIARLDRSTTVAVLPGGILEEHGPYLPTFTDGYLNDRLTQLLANAIVVSKPGWNVLVFPSIPLGNSGANDIGRRYSFPGTYTVRFETLRAIYMDLADELGGQGFKWIFVMHLHGAPNHSRALDAAGDYFHDTFGGRMVHLAGLMPVFSAIEGKKSEVATKEDGLPIHSGMDETSWLMHLRPDLVRPEYKKAPVLADQTMQGLAKIASEKNWPGYFGSPRLATAEHGRQIWEGVSAEVITVALNILNGADPRKIPRFADEMAKSKIDVQLDAASRTAEAERAARQRKWIQSRSK